MADKNGQKDPHPTIDRRAFPKLEPNEMETLALSAVCEQFEEGQTVLKVGQDDIDFFVVESGSVDILNPSNNNALIVTHGPGEFIGDIDLLTRRPVVITAVARGTTRLLRVPGADLRRLLNTVPELSQKLLVAFQVRRELLSTAEVMGIKVIGAGHCRDTNLVREFLFKNFVPFTWFDTETDAGKVALKDVGSPRRTPAVLCGDGRLLVAPSLPDLSRCVGIWRDCPSAEFDLIVVGAGPAGIAAAVYAASEGLKTIVLDRLGPGGQAGGSSRIENFMGFPAGLSGTDLATRGVLQMLKFGAKLAAPVAVESIEPAEKPYGMHTLHLDCGGQLRAPVVLAATGVTWRKLEVPGADQFDRAGIYYACTSVEAMLHQNTDVAVVGAGNSAGQAAMFLATTCVRVHLLVRRGEMSASMSEYLEARIKEKKNITVHYNTEVVEVLGKRRLEGVVVANRLDNTRSTLPLTAVFVFIGAEPHADWLPKSVATDEFGYVLTGADVTRKDLWPLPERDPCPLETNIPGLLAAGDLRAGATKRVGFAVGDGSLAVTCVHKLRSYMAAPVAAS